MSKPSQHRRILYVSLLLILAMAMIAMRHAYSFRGHAFAGILLDPDGVVSSFGIPTWDGFEKGLRFPDRIVSVDGVAIRRGDGARSAGAAWNEALSRAAAAGRDRVSVVAETAGGERRLELALSPLDPAAFWLNGVVPIGIALLYALGALIALMASPRGELARTFARTTLFAALFLLTLFDYHTTRRLVPLFHLAFAMVPMGFFVLPLRLPDDVPLLARRPWIPRALDAVGLALGLGMIGAELASASTLALRTICSALFAASFLFFAATFLARFARARDDRRATMRALLVAMVPSHLIIGSAFVLASLSIWGATSMLLAVPALALTPLSSVFALIRHDLWGSRALLSRVLIRVVVIGSTSALAVVVGTAVAAIFDVPLGGALIAALGAGLTAGVVLEPALRTADSALFPARAVYKPTIEQLSEELTSVNDPAAVGHAVERTVRRWLPCEHVEFVPLGDRGGGGDDHEISGIRVRSSAPGDEAQSVDRLTIDVLFRDSPLAVLRVGKKRGGALFTSEDVDLLRTIGNQAALALAHAYSYQELEERRLQQAAAWRGEREALVETVAAEIAHEVRYPINYFRSIFRRGAGTVELDAEEVDIGCDEVERLERLVSGLRRVFTRRLERRAVRVAELCDKVERLLRDQLGDRRLELRLEGAPGLRCDPDQTTQVLVNLVSNALDAAGEGGRVGVSWSSTTLTSAREPPSAAAERGVLSVWDTGPGFGGDPARVFLPWYTTKPRGTGLGLAISHRIVRAHGWKIEAEREGARTRFVIEIPHPDLVYRDSSEEVA